MLGFLEYVFFRDHHVVAKGAVVRISQYTKRVTLHDRVGTPVKARIDDHLHANKQRIGVLTHISNYATTVGSQDHAVVGNVGLLPPRPDITVIERSVMHAH